MSEDVMYGFCFYHKVSDYKPSNDLDRLIDYCNTPCYRYKVEDYICCAVIPFPITPTETGNIMCRIDPSKYP